MTLWCSNGLACSFCRSRHHQVFYTTHYSDVIMTTMASPITSLTVVYSIVYSDADERKTPTLRVTGLCAKNSSVNSEFPAQRASDAENASIWWRHYDLHTDTTNFFMKMCCDVIETCFAQNIIWWILACHEMCSTIFFNIWQVRF